MWVQCDEPPEGGVFEAPPGEGVVDEPLGACVVADVELVEPDVVEDELLVAAPATAAPPPTRTPASPTPASVCRSRIFIRFTSFHREITRHCLPSSDDLSDDLSLTTLTGSGSRLSGSATTVGPVPERGLAAHWQFPKELVAFA